MKKKMPLILSVIALSTGLSACSTHYQTSLTEGLDPQVSPRQDFYSYVNGKWQQTAKIPDDRSSWGTLGELDELNEQRSIELLKQIVADKNLAQNPAAIRIKNLYDTYTDLALREKLGLTPIQQDLTKIDHIHTIADLNRYLINETKQGNGALFGWEAFAHLKQSRQNAVYLSNDNLGLSRDYFQKDTPENRKTLTQYQAFVTKILEFAQVPNASKRAKAIVEYEKAIAKTLFTNEESRNIEKHFNPVSMAQLKKLSKQIDLATFLQEIGVQTSEVILWEPNYFKQFDQLINAKNLPVIKDYLRFKTLSSASDALNKALYDTSFDFYSHQLRGQKAQRSLDKRSLSKVNNLLGEEFAQFYVAKFFPEQAKKELLTMASYLVKAYHNRIDNLTWMSDTTKQKAKVKLDKFVTEVGYPNKWKDYSALTLKSKEEGGSFYENLKAISQWAYQDELNKVGKPVDINEWGMLPQIVNASYSPLMNRIVFPAGILQAPLYDIKADPAVNFGAIGAIIGHEITHGFDDSGSKFDGEGNLVNWWTAEDRQRFEKLADRLVAQFNQFEVAPNVYVNGRFTLGENIADLGGLSIAYDAMKLYQQDHGTVKAIDNLTQDQRFFMSWTRSWRAKATVQSLTHQVKSDPHAPGKFRAFAPVLNISYFHKVFGTQPGDKMYKSPSEQIKIW